MDGLEKNYCKVCGFEESRSKYQCESYLLKECVNCKMLWKDYKLELNKQEIQKIQDNEYSGQGRLTPLKKMMIKKLSQDRFELLAKNKKNGILLEIGCATGEFLDIASKNNFETLGLEASIIYSNYAKSKGLKIINGYLEDLDEKQSFDVIAMFHLFEHIENPDSFLLDLKKYLKDNGLLMFVVPNHDSFTNKFFGYNHPVYQQSDHLFFYNQRTLSLILEHNGYKVISIESKEYPHHPFTSLSSFLARKYKNYIESKKSDELNPYQKATREKKNTKSNLSNEKKSYLRFLADKLPYLLGTIFFPVLKIYGFFLERLNKGHELIIFAAKNDD